MKRAIIAICLAFLAAISVLTISSAATSAGPTMVMPGSLTWAPLKGAPGVQTAAVWGDPTKPGPFIIRLKFEDGAKVGLHWHPQDEHATVLSGTLMFAFTDKVDAAKLKPLGPGTFYYVPKGARHYGVAKGPTVVQISGMGPRVTNMVK